MTGESTQLRAALLAAHAATADLLRGLTGDLKSVVDAATDVATDDEHDPEGATIAYERSRLSALITQADEQLLEIQAALERIAAGSYGRCEVCGERIASARLEALPATRTCRDCSSRTARR
jgi:DnaK suppressor protein